MSGQQPTNVRRRSGPRATLAAVAALLLVLAACGEADDAATADDPPDTDDAATADDPPDTDDGEDEDLEEVTITAGLSGPKSGAAAGWGIGMAWAAQAAADDLNEAGGVVADGVRYTFDVVSYDNEYDAGVGAQIGQQMIQRDQVGFIAASIGTAPMQALQALTESEPMVHFTTAWGADTKGPDFPYTFTEINTPFEVLEPLYGFVMDENPDIETVVMINPNDATGEQTEEVAQDVWPQFGVEIVGSEFYERGTTEFAGIATSLIQSGADAIDMATTPPGEAGLLARALADQGWDGVQIVSAGTGGADLVEAGGEAAEGTYMGLAADFESDAATETQQRLAVGLREAEGETLNTISIGAYDAMMAFAAAIEHAGTTDPDAIAQALTEIIIETSYGPSVFGGEDIYGSPQQLLLPVFVTQVQDGETVEREVVRPAELEERLAELGG